QWLEVKNAGNEAYTIKTRMNWLGWNRQTGSEAKVGFHPEGLDFQGLVAVREGRLSRYFTEHRLDTISDVNAGEAEDITSYYRSKAVNLCPDWKRLFAGDGTSRPFEDMREFTRYRRVVDALGAEAWPDLVTFRLDAKKPGMTEQAVRREVLHRIAMSLPGFRLPGGLSRRLAWKILGVPPIGR